MFGGIVLGPTVVFKFNEGYTSVLAWVVAFVVYQVGSFFMSL